VVDPNPRPVAGVSRDPHELEYARAAYAVLVEKTKTAKEKQKLRKELREWEQQSINN
jgi:hypothetical protein